MIALIRRTVNSQCLMCSTFPIDVLISKCTLVDTMRLHSCALQEVIISTEVCAYMPEKEAGHYQIDFSSQ